MTDIVCVSDLHGHLPDIPPCGMLLIGGDICPVSDHRLAFQAAWLSGEFRRWLESIPAEKVVAVAGNHDLLFQQRPDLVPADLPWTYLQDGGTEFAGLKIWGSPWQPVFHNWAFNAEDDFRKDRWSLIPEDTDILLLHGPPYGYGDLVWAKTTEGEDERVGCRFLAERIAALPRLKLVVFGHIHSGHGVYTLAERGWLLPLLVNASLVDERYRPVNKTWQGQLLDGSVYFS